MTRDQIQELKNKVTRMKNLACPLPYLCECAKCQDLFRARAELQLHVDPHSGGAKHSTRNQWTGAGIDLLRHYEEGRI